uniref:RNA helicase n=1 Tax=Leptocylindrus danicus TaxID=163516 RepID=A0A7S2LTE3_9STRA|mmetsp:Transcript_9218/g.13852  ORF Transcript_9218/g.13852 Transcript_9218/m.13852 type:complete len:803 (+) Transcript_9218:86-2494(+)
MASLHETLSSDEELLNKEDEDDEELDGNFDFGGMMGEDGRLTSHSIQARNGMRTALEVLADGAKKTYGVEKTKVESIIAAERSNLKNKKQQNGKDSDDSDASESSGSDDEDDEASGATESESASDAEDEEDDSESASDDDSDDEVDDAEIAQNMAGDKLVPRTEAVDDEELEARNQQNEAVKLNQFFDATKTSAGDDTGIHSFHQFSISRPVLKAIEGVLGYTAPTPVQSMCIPIIQNGRDVCASAQTGSGKTCAFLIPIVEGLLNTSSVAKDGAKALILTPTRELACQIYTNLTKLAKYCPSLTATLITGGSKNSTAQAQELRKFPHIIIATPGRLVDHLVNTAAFDLLSLQYLVLDEADRLLELGFEEELIEIVKQCNTERRTLLFSATMGSSSLDQLTSLALKKPVRVNCISKSGSEDPLEATTKSITIPKRITQEFIRLQSDNPVRRDAIILALLTRTFTSSVMVFIETKVLAHRMRILLGLCGISVGELHGNLTQAERMENLSKFEAGETNVLICTDLAARGLDFKVHTVINYEIPNQLATYVHRIGRTGRAGRKGTSCSLVSEGRRQNMKKIISLSPQSPAVTRTIPPDVIGHFMKKIETLQESINVVLEAEYVARLDAKTQMELKKAQNMIEHADEIAARPRKEWIKSNKEKIADAADRTEEAVSKVPGMHRMTRKKRRRMEAKAVFSHFNNNDDDEAPPLPKPRKVKEPMHDPFADDLPKKKKKKEKKSSIEKSEFSAEPNEQRERAEPPLGSKKMKEEIIGGTYHFRGYDPDKKLGKKKGTKKFKSRAKYKRR